MVGKAPSGSVLILAMLAVRDLQLELKVLQRGESRCNVDRLLGKQIGEDWDKYAAQYKYGCTCKACSKTSHAPGKPNFTFLIRKTPSHF